MPSLLFSHPKTYGAGATTHHWCVDAAWGGGRGRRGRFRSSCGGAGGGHSDDDLHQRRRAGGYCVSALAMARRADRRHA